MNRETKQELSINDSIIQEVQRRINACIFTDKELHCIARMLQVEIFKKVESSVGRDLQIACFFCKYKDECVDRDTGEDTKATLRKKLMEATGVYLGNGILSPHRINFFKESYAQCHPKAYRTWVEKISPHLPDEAIYTEKDIEEFNERLSKIFR